MQFFRTKSASASAFVILFALAVPSSAQNALPAGGVAITGAVQHPVTLTRADLKAAPAATVAVSFLTDHGQESATYTGALLWAILQGAGLVDGSAKGAKLRHVIYVDGRDGYVVALSLGEIDPDFEGKSVILAYATDGKPLDPATSIRLIVPADHHGGRAVRDVVRIYVE